MPQNDDSASWPPLPYQAWRDTYQTLHLWLQIVGKISLAQCSWINHSWHVALLTTARGLSTRLLGTGDKAFQIDFDFVEHVLSIRLLNGAVVAIPLEPRSTASFYRKIMDAMKQVGVPVAIHTMPSELPDAIPFDTDEVHGSYDREFANRYWRVLAQTSRVFEDFRARFIGKCSPVHYFWGSADLAVTRFSGRTAPPHPGGIPNLPDWVAREAYSHEVSSAGFWAGNDQNPEAVFYSYAYPDPPGFADARVSPEAAHFSASLREFVLPYEAMRTARAPEQALLAFLQSTYEAAATLGQWDRKALERASDRQ
ncbi:MAG TPA: DUF5996 family protein [Steroidobacter sp.]|uniref:DUF5996 family protein n=1 Tax=Steroidobacter sp. TaxID=1978227 RepID=UPI002ED7C770